MSKSNLIYYTAEMSGLWFCWGECMARHEQHQGLAIRMLMRTTARQWLRIDEVSVVE